MNVEDLLNNSNLICNHSSMEEEIIDEYKQNYDETQYNQNEENLRNKCSKRIREEMDSLSDESEWKVAGRKGKKLKEENDIVEMYVTSKDKLPKQITLAKLLKENTITDVTRVKYLNPYKIRVDIANESCAAKFEVCKKFLDLGWRFQRAMERSVSYGVIKDIDLELSDEDLLSSISCPKPGMLVSILRLNRRNSEDYSWLPSEAIRLCFKGTFIPQYVFVESLRIYVEPYVFPVTQCSKCWRYGHSLKKCPSHKVVCPKCGQNHENCEVSRYKCINCGGNHMALVKTCPSYLKEKRLREIMSEFNCTYRKALMMYVPTNSSTEQEPNVAPKLENPILSAEPIETPLPQAQSTPTFADVVKIKAANSNTEKPKSNTFFPKKHVRKEKDTEFDFSLQSILSGRQTQEYKQEQNAREEDKYQRVKDVNFSELLERLKEIIFLKHESIQVKFKNVLKCCVEWLVLVVVDNIADWPILNLILDYFNG